MAKRNPSSQPNTGRSDIWCGVSAARNLDGSYAVSIAWGSAEPIEKVSCNIKSIQKQLPMYQSFDHTFNVEAVELAGEIYLEVVTIDGSDQICVFRPPCSCKPIDPESFEFVTENNRGIAGLQPNVLLSINVVDSYFQGSQRHWIEGHFLIGPSSQIRDKLDTQEGYSLNRVITYDIQKGIGDKICKSTLELQIDMVVSGRVTPMFYSCGLLTIPRINSYVFDRCDEFVRDDCLELAAQISADVPFCPYMTGRFVFPGQDISNGFSSEKYALSAETVGV